MGNQLSSIQSISSSPNKINTENVGKLVDYIATHYILTMDFQSLTKLFDKEYCDNLVIITSEVFERQLTDMEIVYLAERIKSGQAKGSEEEEEEEETDKLEKDKVLFFDKNKLDKLDIQDHVKKRHVCLGIAKFYIKVAHLFAGIVKTINPRYTYKDIKTNTTKQATLAEKETIPKDAHIEVLNYNLCNNLVNALVNNNDYSDIRDYNDITIQPNICSVNVNEKGETKSLIDEIGIPELEALYLDDDYDFEKGVFKGMTKATQEMYDEDLNQFYTFFTGNNSMPEDIRRFSDIKLKDYHNSFECRGNGLAPGQMPLFYTPVRGKLSDDLFSKYATNLKSMIENANKNQNELTDTLDALFTYSIDPKTNEKMIRVNPELTDEILQNMIVTTRAIIMKLYLTCERDFDEAVKIYQAILKKKLLETTENQIKTMDKLTENLNNVTDKEPEPAENKLLNKEEENINTEKESKPLEAKPLEVKPLEKENEKEKELTDVPEK
jgi:hypothetical protein